MRIAANDPNLAHSLSRARFADPITVGWKHIRSAKSGIDFARRIEGAIKTNGLVLSSSVGKADAMVIAITRVPGDLRLCLFCWTRQGGASVRPCGVAFSPHAVARLFQRGVGEADIPAALAHVQQHLRMLVIKMPEAFKDHGPHEFEIATNTGCLCGEVVKREDGGFTGIVKTFIDKRRPGIADDTVQYQPRLLGVSHL